MCRLLYPFVALLLLVLLLAPPAAAEDENGGGSEKRGGPPQETAPAATKTEEPQVVPGRPSTYYQPKPATEPGTDGGAGGEADGKALEAPTPFVMPTESTVIEVRKSHNAPWFGNWLALELDMRFAVVGQAGKYVGATVTFFESGNGRPLRAATQPYVDALGHLSVYTRFVPVKSNGRLFRAKLKIPYKAFPWPTSGPTYGVEARVRLMNRDKAGKFGLLARSATAFTIHYERGCGCPSKKDPDCCRCPEWVWDFGYTWCNIWGADMGPTPSQVPCLPPPKGRGRRADWFEARWRTRGSDVDELQRRLNRAPTTQTGPR